jgi:TetR/AcrR family transcriptional repressor of nem operon
MPRTKSFEEKDVLNSAMRCFWKKGYTATSMKDLEMTTGLKTSSLYHSYTSKDVLFIATIEQYFAQIVTQRVAKMATADDPLAGIQFYFRSSFVDGEKHNPYGCFLVNTIVELGPHESHVRHVVLDKLCYVEKQLSHALTRAIGAGQIRQDVDVQILAKQLLLLYQGMLVSSKAAKSERWYEVGMQALERLLQ